MSVTAARPGVGFGKGLQRRGGAGRLPRGVILSLVCAIVGSMILATAIPSAMAAIATATPPSPLCKSIGASQITWYDVQSGANATNASPSWRESPGGLKTTFAWGNTTSYLFGTSTASVTKTYSNGSASYAGPYLDFLDPGGTYYFMLVVSIPTGYCQPSGTTYEGSWQSPSDSALYISGMVFNSTLQPAPANLEVEVTCARPTDGDQSLVGQVDTSSSGSYSVYLPNYGLTACNKLGSAYTGFNVTVLNTAWPGYFNETVILWGAQILDFALASNFISPYIPVITDFSNANSSTGMADYSIIGYTAGTTYTTSESFCVVIVFWGGCRSTSTSFSSTHTYTSENGNDFVSQRYWTSGTTLYDALNRTAWLVNTVYYEAYGAPQFPAQQPITDWLTPSTYSTYGGYYLQGWGSQGYGVPVYYGYPQGEGLSTSSTSATTGVTEIQVSVDVSVGIPDSPVAVGVGVGVLDLKWSQTSSYTSSDSLSWMAQVPVNTSVPTCFVVYGEGGSQSKNTADIIGLWAYTPTGSPGDYTCPLP
jgi:hypothetical protein